MCAPASQSRNLQLPPRAGGLQKIYFFVKVEYERTKESARFKRFGILQMRREIAGRYNILGERMAKKKTELTEEERDAIESQIRTLQSRLDAPTSDIGDWKIIKIYEARLSGESDPYNYEELKAARQAARDKINELQAQLKGAE